MRLLKAVVLCAISSILYAQDIAMITLISDDLVTLDGREIAAVQNMTVIMTDDQLCNTIGKIWNQAVVSEVVVPKADIKYTVSLSVISRGINYKVLLCKTESGSKYCRLSGNKCMKTAELDKVLPFLEKFPFLHITPSTTPAITP